MAEKQRRKQTDKPSGDRPAAGPGRPQAPKRPGGAGTSTGPARGTSRPTRGRPAAQGTTTFRSGAHPKPGTKPGTKPGARPAPAARRDDSPQTVLAVYRPDLAKALDAAEAPSFRYAQVLEHLMRRPGIPLAEASNLPADLRAALDHGGPSVLSVAATRKAADGTTKLLLEARDGANIETVLLPYGNRLTVCISSQVGCAVGCAFCATGALGFRRNLSTAEIVDQVRMAAVACEPGQRLTNVVYMGMGEPLLNLGAVLESVHVLTAPSALGLGRRSLSISTVGIPNGILRLAKTEPQVNLALSLHAADDATRALLIPERYRHPLSEILEAAWQHFEVTRRKLLVEYVLIAGVNDTVDDAARLAALLRGHVVTVNLLAWNPVSPEAGPEARTGENSESSVKATENKRAPRRRTFYPSTPAALSAFRAVLRAAHIEAVVRQSKGAGIEAACGQLAGAAQSYKEPATD
jgi:23S rRNA (adenine2503-C2)-methyltransferase